MIKSNIGSLHSKVSLSLGVLFILFFGTFAEGKPLKIEVNKGIKEPLNVSIPSFISDIDLRELSENITAIITDDLVGTGLFKVTERVNHLSVITNFDNPIDYSAWNSIESRALLTGELSSNGTTSITVKFRLFDVLSEKPFKEGLKLTGPKKGWRRIAHKIADEVYARVTGDHKYFDSRIAFVAEEGSKGNRTKRLVIMDYDGANQAFLTERSDFIVLSPKFSPNGSKLLYTSYETGSPRICLLDIRSRKKIFLDNEPGNMSFSPSFSNIGISYAKEFSNSIYGGFTLRMISERISNVSSGGMAFDAGIQYVTGDNDKVKFGVALKNVGPRLMFKGDGLSFRGWVNSGS